MTRMEIRVFGSFSCNNSTSFRIIARFESEGAAEAVANELESFFLEARPLAARRKRRQTTPLTTSSSFPITEAIDALAAEHGFDWSGMLSAYDDDDLELVTEGKTLLLYHHYCLGLGSDLPAYLIARGGQGVHTRSGDPPVAVFFRRTESTDASFVERFAAFFDELARVPAGNERKLGQPWVERKPGQPIYWGSSAAAAYFDDGRTVGFTLTLTASQIIALKEHLQAEAVEGLTIRIAEGGDLDRIRALQDARCAHCGHALLYVDRNEHDLLRDQLACESCGGMFELE